MSTAVSIAYTPFPGVLQVLYGGLMLSYLGFVFRRDEDINTEDVRHRILLGFVYYEFLASLIGLILMIILLVRLPLLFPLSGYVGRTPLASYDGVPRDPSAEPRQLFTSFAKMLLGTFALSLSVSTMTLVYFYGPMEIDDWKRKALIVLSWLRLLGGFTMNPLRREWWIPKYEFRV